MKLPSRFCLAFSLLALAPPFLTGQTTPKVLVVDMARLYDTHHKTQEQNTKLKAEEKSLEGEIEKLNAEGTSLIEQYKQLVEQTKNPALAADSRGKATEAAQAKGIELQKKTTEVQTFRTNAQRQLQQRVAVFREALLKEIGVVVGEMAKRKGATMVIDRAGPTLIGISAFVYLDPSFDMTDEVMKELAKDRPANLPMPAAGTPAAPGADAPTVTFPGSKK